MTYNDDHIEGERMVSVRNFDVNDEFAFIIECSSS